MHSSPADILSIFTSLRGGREPGAEQRSLVDVARQLWLTGVPVNWNAYYAGQNRSRIPLPTYPFERKRHWVEQEPAAKRNEVKQHTAGTPGNAAIDLPTSFVYTGKLETLLQSQLEIMSEQLRLISAKA